MGYLGNQSTFTGSQNNKRISVLATAGQTLFTVAGGYNINQLDVYRNGVKLAVQRDFTATDGTSVNLVIGASSGDILEFVVFENFLVADALTGDGDQTINGNLVVSGTISGSIPIATEAVRAGIATEAVRAGIATSAESLNAGATGSDLNLSGIVTAVQFVGNITGTAATFTGNVTVGGTLTYDDVTNIDSIGLITARNGLQVTGGIATVTGQTNLANVNVSAASTFSGEVDINSTVIPNEIRFSNVSEKMVRVSTSSSIGVCTYSSDTGNIIYFDAPSDDVVIRVEGIPETSAFDNHTITVSAILRTTGTGRSCHDHVRLNGVEIPVKFSGGSRNDATAGVTTSNGYTTYNFVGVNTIGSASSAANYEVFGVVSGGFF